MGLEKTLELETGSTGNYWKVVSVRINRNSENSKVDLGLFKDKTSSDAGKQSLLVKPYTWAGTGFPYTVEALDADNPMSIAYAKIKADDPWFADAIDVLET